MLRPVPFFSALLVNGDPAVARRLQRILGALAPGQQVQLAATRAEAEGLLATFLFDLVLIDMQLRPAGDGATLVERVRAAQPRAQVIAVSDMDHHALVVSAFTAGAAGYLLSEADDAELAHALRALHSGGVALDARAARHVLGMLAALLRRDGGASPMPEPAQAPFALRPRELQLLRLIADGLSNRQIAQTLAVSVHTVEFHAKNAYRKLEVNSRTQAIAEATRHGLLG
jgi:DNA-binding NarL/FixJ family response regulator